MGQGASANARARNGHPGSRLAGFADPRGVVPFAAPDGIQAKAQFGLRRDEEQIAVHAIAETVRLEPVFTVVASTQSGSQPLSASPHSCDTGHQTVRAIDCSIAVPTYCGAQHWPIWGIRLDAAPSPISSEDNGIEPTPERHAHTRWSTFLKAHWQCLAATDFLRVEVWAIKKVERGIQPLPRPDLIEPPSA